MNTLFEVAAFPVCLRCGTLTYNEVRAGPTCTNCGDHVILTTKRLN